MIHNNQFASCHELISESERNDLYDHDRKFAVNYVIKYVFKYVF